MSRYNGAVTDMMSPFTQLLFLIFIGVPFTLVFVVLAVVYDADKAEEIICSATAIEPSDSQKNSDRNYR